MPRTALTVQTIGVAGITPTYAAGDSANGHEFSNDGNMFLHVKNSNAAVRNVTVKVSGYKVGGTSLADLVVNIPANTGDKMIGPFDPTAFNQVGGLVNVDLDASAGLTIAAIKLP